MKPLVIFCLLIATYRTSRALQSLSRNLSYHEWGMPSQVQIVPGVQMQDTRGRNHPSYVFVDKDSETTYPRKRSSRQIGEESLSKAVSKNITRILEDLLKDYDKTERPSYKEGKTTKVKVNILIRSMGPISEMKMFYSMDCYFRQYWRDKRLSFKGLKNNANNLVINQLSLNVAMLEKIWKPDTYFHNGLDSYLHAITRPNKLLRISENGDITYSIRLTVKAKCPMILNNFPMDQQTCPLIFGSFAYTADEVEYKWLEGSTPVGYEGELHLSQFDLQKTFFRELNFTRSESVGTFSVLQVMFILQRHTGYFLIQVYLPCALIVVLSWVGFWLNREATSDRVTLGVTAVLTLSAISMDSRSDLPKVHYATALDWFIICSFLYCMASILEFAGVHYFTKVGSGEFFGNDGIESDIIADNEDDDEWEDLEDWKLETPNESNGHSQPKFASVEVSNSILKAVPNQTNHNNHTGIPHTMPMNHRPINPLNHNCISAYNNAYGLNGSLSESSESVPVLPPPGYQMNHFSLHRPTSFNGIRGQAAGRQQPAGIIKSPLSQESNPSLDTLDSLKSGLKIAQTQTEKKLSLFKQFTYCFMANEKFRKQREKAAALTGVSFNSVSKIDSCARLLFPLSFLLFNLIYWTNYFKSAKPFSWEDHAVRGNLRE